jgi:transcriptional regulator with XRE-family HTH domain
MDGRQHLRRFLEKNSQARLAREVGCSEAHLSLVLSGQRGASLRLALKLSDATGIPIEKLDLERKPNEAAA